MWGLPGVGGMERGLPDSIRKFMKGDACIESFIQAVNGLSAISESWGRRSPSLHQAHECLPLMDLVTTTSKNNGAVWPFGPFRWRNDDNSRGIPAEITRFGARVCATCSLCNSFRVVCDDAGGDEFARTQNGNNNPYKIDSIGMWLNFDMIATRAHSIPTAAPALITTITAVI